MEDFIYKNLIKFLDNKLDDAWNTADRLENSTDTIKLKYTLGELDAYREVKAKLLELNEQYWKLVGRTNTNQINRLVDET